jgi:uncharacterized repeat protein (TIGR01451 family)/CSLREA domain-containing protein
LPLGHRYEGIPMATAGTRRAIAVAITLLAALACAASASAATYSVNTTADAATAGGCVSIPECTLREAVAAANAGNNDTISLPAGRYVLSLGQLAPTKDTEIDGAGARTTILDGNDASRVFDVSSDNLTMRDLTITGGRSLLADGGDLPGDGGGILALGGRLDLVRVGLIGNRSDQNGGGLAAPPENGTVSDIHITDSTVATNAVSGGAAEGQGGGIYVEGAATITNSTFTGNSVSNPGANAGGGIAAIKDTGSAAPTTVSLLNTTVAGNSVTTGTAGGFSGGNPAPSTFLSTLDARNTVIAGNTVGGATGDCGFSGMNLATTSDHDLSSDASCGFSDGGSVQNADPKLGPLANNGGPTDTRALLAGSPAINAGTNAGCPAADQRGTARPQADTCDIGAFELVFSADLAVTQTAPKDPTVLGSPVTYTATVRNNGPQPAAGVVLTDTLPSGSKLVSAKGATCSGAPVVCQVPDLAPGTSTVVTIKASAPRIGVATNKAVVTGAYSDPDLTNNTSTVSSTVVARADLSVRERASAETVRVGRRVTFTATVHNAGPNTASGPVLQVPRSRGLNLLSVHGAVKCRGTTVVKCTLKKLAKGRSRTVKLVMSATRRGRLRSTVSASSKVKDPRKTNNRAVASVLARSASRGLLPVFTG